MHKGPALAAVLAQGAVAAVPALAGGLEAAPEAGSVLALVLARVLVRARVLVPALPRAEESWEPAEAVVSPESRDPLPRRLEAGMHRSGMGAGQAQQHCCVIPVP